jgi:hypothetical protein
MGFTSILAGGALSGAGSLASGILNSNAANSASQAQVAEQQLALAQQKSLYNQGLGIQSGYVGQAQGALNPFIAAGQSNIPTLNALLSPGSSASTLSQMPGFQFQSQYGTMAATNALAARSGPSAGPLATAISQYNNGLAGTQYFNTVNALQNSVNTGAGAASTLGGVLGNAGNTALGAGVNEGNSQASTLGSIGNAQASGILGSASAIGTGISGSTNAVNNATLFSALTGNGNSGLYTPSQIAGIGNMDASLVSPQQSAAYGTAMGLT